MARRPRPNFPGIWFHAMTRGNNRGNIFIDENDYRTFQRILSLALIKYRFGLHAYCLMSNHVHLLLQSYEGNLSLFMGWMLGVYARAFNSKHGRVGHLFQGRFLAKIISKSSYLLEVGRYIHMNPVQARLAARPQDYQWSSMGSYLGQACFVPIIRDVLMPLDGEIQRKGFVDFTVARASLAGDYNGWPREGGWYDEDIKALEQPPRLLHEPQVVESPEGTLQRVASYFGFDVENLIHGWRNPARGDARAIAMMALRVKDHLSMREIGVRLGFKSQQGVYNTFSRLRHRLMVDPVLQKTVKELGLSETH